MMSYLYSTRSISYWISAVHIKINQIDIIFQRIRTRLWFSIWFDSIGAGSWIKSPILVANPQFICIGKNVSIRNHARLEVVIDGINSPQLVIGDNCNIEQNVHIVCHDRVVIGNNVSITANCAIIDTTHPFDDLLPHQKIGGRICTARSSVVIGDGTFIGIGSIIFPNVHIGKNVVVGAHSVVTRDIPDFAVVAGNPAKVLRLWRDHCKV